MRVDFVLRSAEVQLEKQRCEIKKAVRNDPFSGNFNLVNFWCWLCCHYDGGLMAPNQSKCVLHSPETILMIVRNDPYDWQKRSLEDAETILMIGRNDPTKSQKRSVSDLLKIVKKNLKILTAGVTLLLHPL